jgi:CPA2 family monovalent cation:H+ antiporter-2
MDGDARLFVDLALVFLAATLGAAVARAARQPLLLGYVLGGLAVSPLTPGPSVSDVRSFDLFAQVGVVLLMFSIGIEFSLRELLRLRRVAFLGGPLGVAIITGLGALAGPLAGLSRAEGLGLGAVLSVCSTMVLSRLLMDRGELHTRHGRIMMGTSLAEDLSTVVLLALIPAMGTFGTDRLLGVAMGLGQAALVLLPFWFLVARAVPWLMVRVARLRNDELFLLVILTHGLGTAALAHAVGVSLAVGAFLAGLVISESDYAHETMDRLLSLRDAFGALFFVTVGALLNPFTLADNLPLVALMTGLVLGGKLAVRAGLLLLFGESLRTAVRVGLGLAQVGEFSFVLVHAARQADLLGDEVYNATLGVSLVTILANVVLTRLAASWTGGMVRIAGPGQPPDQAAPGGHVVLCGFGRVGSAIGEALLTFDVPHVVIEADRDIVRALGARGVPSVQGDAARRRALDAARVGDAALVVVSFADSHRADLVVRNVRALNPGAAILARAHHREASERLIGAGATEVIQPELEAAATLIRHALDRLSVSRSRVLSYLERFRVAMAVAAAPAGSSLDAMPDVSDVLIGEGSLADQSLRDAKIRERMGVTVVAVSRPSGDVLINPHPETVLRAGDRVRVFGLPGQIDAFRREAGQL